jgi:ribonuclease P protein component
MAHIDGAQRRPFSRSQRLLNKAAFEVVYARGRRSGDALFGLCVLRRDEGPARLGMSVGVKVAGGAVQRNRIRRVIRESFRLAQHDLTGCDIVITARAGARGAQGAQMHSSLAAHWQRLLARAR